ncbi:MAG TPA: glycosyltransferase family 2 protein [Geminicoccaceae bacterium]|nr:glycosyltransferase family 2 protein [Geminicoccus sp.]HMU51231.1 glycosyltransferase family 2 protein [Geminicoccaceae bacterium]
MTATAAADRLVLIPSYNTGPLVLRTVRDARAAWSPVWVVVDGSTDGTGEALRDLARDDPGLHVIVRQPNAGKGAAVLAGAVEARRQGFAHVLTMDADGQHPADRIAAFMAASRQRPEAMILGAPLFDATAPAVRVQGRKISNRLARLEALGAAIDDVLCGFRVYPIDPLVRAMSDSPWMRRFDFDPEVVVRMSWLGVPAVNLPVPVRYLSKAEGGVSHFHYGRDNLLLTWMHLRLLAGAAVRLAVRR